LGRVLALAYLAQERGLDDFRTWGLDWYSALERSFPNEYQQLALHARAGLEALMQSDEDFEEAYHTCANGLLASLSVEMEDLREVAARIVGDAIGQLEELASEV
jgi:hypothetical protein